jgi:hypothetical protein
MSDAINKMLEDHDAIRRMIEPYGAVKTQIELATKALKGIDAINSIDPYLTQASLGDKASWEPYRSLVGSQFDVTLRSAALDAQWAARALQPSGIDHFARLASFRSPKVAEFEKFARLAVTADSWATKFLASPLAMQTKMEAMRNPWLHGDLSRAVRGFSEIQAIGAALNQRSPFDLDLSTSLRNSLGDWRDAFEPSAALMLDPDRRSQLYVERGFDSALTDFSEAAFAESLSIAGLVETTSKVVDEQQLNELEMGLQRNLRAFGHLQRFEIEVRQFIVAAMHAAFGDTWIKRQTPPGMLDGWKEKKQKAMEAGDTDRPLIEYADFTDYKAIIERSDNWKQVFARIFRRQEDVRESFQRLFPVRIATMHARINTLEDEMLLIVETKRILKAIRTSSVELEQ